MKATDLLPVNETAILWDQFVVSRDVMLRERLLIHYLPLVRQVAGRMKTAVPGSVEYDDLVNAGILGLIAAVDNFEPARGNKFETYAATRVRGAILDGLREVDWLPRSLRQKSRKLENVVNKLISEKDGVPTDEEIAVGLGLDEEGYFKFLDGAGAASLVSLDTAMNVGDEGETASLHEVISDEDAESPLDKVVNLDARRSVLKLIDSLNEQEKSVVALYYYEELTFREISEVLGVSESRICQIHTRLIAILRVKLGKLME